MDALDELQQIEGVGVDPRIIALQEAWIAVSARSDTEIITVDVLRAEALAHAVDAGLCHREIALALKISQSFVVYLLRYHRFLITRVIKIQEGTFRKYWTALSDPHEQTRDPIKRAAYEESVFQHITKQIDAGIPPQKHPRMVKPVTRADIRKKADPIAAYRKEVEKRKKEVIDPFVMELKQLLGADRSTYAPSLLGGMGHKLEKIMDDILDLLAPASD